MTNNANEVGAVVRQYIVGGKQPILLNNRVTAHMSSKQNFNVWVTGISENNGFYKFKSLSEGISSNNAKHTEAAIINVSTETYKARTSPKPPRSSEKTK